MSAVQQSQYSHLYRIKEAQDRRIAELERDNAELKRLWFSDADPSETLFAAEYAALAKIKEAS